MTFKKLTLGSLILVALLSVSYSGTSSAKKLTCDVTDAPNVDLINITNSLEKRINTLTQLASDLQKTRAELDTAATKEIIGIILVDASAIVKAASAIALSAGILTSEPVAASPGVFAATVLSNTANFINDAINSQGQSQDKVLVNSLKSYGASNIDTIGGKLTELASNPSFGKSWKALSLFYTTVTNMIDLTKTWDSTTNLRTQVAGIDKQLKELNGNITALKSNLSKMKKLVATNETTVDKGFVRTVTEYYKNKTCIPPVANYSGNTILSWATGEELPALQGCYATRFSAKIDLIQKTWSSTVVENKGKTYTCSGTLENINYSPLTSSYIMNYRVTSGLGDGGYFGDESICGSFHTGDIRVLDDGRVRLTAHYGSCWSPFALYPK